MTASLLAGQLGVPIQHALGGLVFFWLGLEEKYPPTVGARSRAGDQEKFECILGEAELLSRLRLAFSLKELSFEPFEACGFISPAAGGWRIET